VPHVRSVGDTVGILVAVGTGVGHFVVGAGDTVGAPVVGAVVGNFVHACVGLFVVGARVGQLVVGGYGVGAGVGLGVQHSLKVQRELEHALEAGFPSVQEGQV